jgi:cytoskeletal protein RodZ
MGEEAARIVIEETLNLTAGDSQSSSTEDVASVLKRAREEKGLSLQEIAASTRIPGYYLRFLEGEEETYPLADALYLVPFLRTYSAFLGLDPAATVPQFIASVQKKEIALEPTERKPQRSLVWTLVILLVLIGLAVLASLWFTYQ